MPSGIYVRTEKNRKKTSDATKRVWAKRSLEERKEIGRKGGEKLRKFYIDHLEARLEQSSRMKEVLANPEIKKKMCKIAQDRWDRMTDEEKKEWKRKLSKAQLKRWADFEEHEKMIKTLNKPETKNRQSESRKKYFSRMTSEEYKKYCERCREVSNRPEVKEKNRRASLALFNDPEFRKKYDEHKNSSEYRIKVSRNMKEYWGNLSVEKRKERVQKALDFRHPNNPEKQLIDLISKYNLPFKYYGYKFHPELSRKIPDFVSVDGSKKIIEFDGKFWHQDLGCDIERNKYYQRNGFSILCLNEDDLVLGEDHVLGRIVLWE